MTRPISDLWRLVDSFMRAYAEYLRDQSHAEKLQKEMETEKDEQKKARLQSEINYYAKTYDKFVKQAISYRDDLNQSIKKVKAITG